MRTPLAVLVSAMLAVTTLPPGGAGRLPALKADDQKPAEPQRFKLDDLDKLVSLDSPQFSPDGKSIVVVVGRKNLEKNRTDSELVLVDVASGKQRILTRGRHSVSQPRWSPSGDRLAFLSSHGAEKSELTQIFVLPMNGGEALRITDSPTDVQHYSWKPDGSAIAYACEDEAENKDEVEKGNDAFEVGNNDFLTKKAPQPVHIWVVSSEGGEARRLTSGRSGLTTVPPPGQSTSPLSWSPDGKTLLFVQQERPHDGDNDKTTIQVLDVESGKSHPLTDRRAFETCASFSPDGSHIAYWYCKDGDPNNIVQIWVAPQTGGIGKCLTAALDRCLYLSAWLPDSQALLVGGNDSNRTSLWLYPLAGSPRRLELGRICPTCSFEMDANISKAGAITFTGSEPNHPTELYYLESATSQPRRLTDFNKEIAQRTLGKMETITWKTEDGFTANGILTYPPDFDKEKQYPLVVNIHGGPEAASLEEFNDLDQLFAAKGYIVFEPNYRGSDNLGSAYQMAIVKDWGAGPARDVMAGLDAVKKRGFVDDKRIAVTGWSYGGYMTTWLIGHYHFWKVAVAGAAVTDWVDMHNLSDGNVQMRHSFGGNPWTGEAVKLYREQSPITYARNIRTPTLILSNTGDARVPITQSYQLYHALKANGVEVKFLAYPVEGHFPSDPVRGKDVYRRWIGWVDDHMK